LTNSDVLALKYRPKNFDELIGQESVSRTLKFSLQNNKIGTGYLFSGLRGSGKTSSARIFAKSILCENRVSSNPCEKCENCEMANNGSHIDIIEMDGASNRKIDDIRDLIDQTQYNPSVGKYKIFIIDEVHMLTKEAFNALLKTLEEPPSYVKFILATTDPLKLPPTILSRTQHFAFKKIDFNLVVKHLENILKIENVDFEKEAVEIISRSGGGSLRDTLTLLQQAIVFSGEKLRSADVISMLGLVDPDVLENIFSLILKIKREKLISEIEKLKEYEAETVLDEFIRFIKNKLLSNELPPTHAERIFKALSEGKMVLSTGADGEFVLYLTFLKMVTIETSTVIERVVETPKIVSRNKKVEFDEQKEVGKQKNSSDDLEEFFWRDVIEESIIFGNSEEKISDSDLKKCIEKHISFNGITENKLKVIFDFTENGNEKCKKILRNRYETIVSITTSQFAKKLKKKLKFEPIIKKVAETKVEDSPIIQDKKQNQTETINSEDFIQNLKDSLGTISIQTTQIR
jgi:DNA polymerase-3 subunit gamma/tau